jgi:hypothetical protein
VITLLHKISFAKAILQIIWVKNNSMDFQISKTIEILNQTPATIKSLLGNLSNDWVYASADENSWNAFDIIGHYIHGEETDWIPRAVIILAQGESVTFESFDRFAQFEISKGKTISELIEIFEFNRRTVEIKGNSSRIRRSNTRTIIGNVGSSRFDAYSTYFYCFGKTVFG